MVAAVLVLAAGTTAGFLWQRGDKEPSMPTLRASLPVGGVAAMGLAVYGGTAYLVVDGEMIGNNQMGSLRVVDTASMTVTSEIPLGANPLGAVFDPRTRYLFITGSQHGGQSWVTVVDTEKNAIKTTIPFAASTAWHIALDSEAQRVYVVGGRPDGTESVLGVLDADLHALLAEIPLPARSTAVVVDPQTHTVYVTSESVDGLTIIDGVNRKVLSTVPIGGSMNGMAIDPDEGVVYTVIDPLPRETGPRKLVVFDTDTNTITATIPLSEIAERVTVDPAARSIYVLEENTESTEWVEQIRVLESGTHEVTTTVALGKGVIVNIEVDPVTHEVYSTDIDTLYKVAR
ncbi:YncE family protein [Nocardia sp. NPDC003693]